MADPPTQVPAGRVGEHSRLEAARDEDGRAASDPPVGDIFPHEPAQPADRDHPDDRAFPFHTSSARASERVTRTRPR